MDYVNPKVYRFTLVEKDEEIQCLACANCASVVLNFGNVSFLLCSHCAYRYGKEIMVVAN